MARRRRNPSPSTIGLGLVGAAALGFIVWKLFSKPKRLLPITGGVLPLPATGGNYIPPGAAPAPAIEVGPTDTFAAAGVPYQAPPLYTAPFTQVGASYVPPGAALPAGT